MDYAEIAMVICTIPLVLAMVALYVTPFVCIIILAIEICKIRNILEKVFKKNLEDNEDYKIVDYVEEKDKNTEEKEKEKEEN